MASRRSGKQAAGAKPQRKAVQQMDLFPAPVDVEALDLRAIGAGPRVEGVWRVRLGYGREAHRVFKDRHGVYCEEHGRLCPAVEAVRSAGQPG